MGGISKCGDAMMRTTLFGAAQVMLTRTIRWSWLKAAQAVAALVFDQRNSVPADWWNDVPRRDDG